MSINMQPTSDKRHVTDAVLLPHRSFSLNLVRGTSAAQRVHIIQLTRLTVATDTVTRFSEDDTSICSMIFLVSFEPLLYISLHQQTVPFHYIGAV